MEGRSTWARALDKTRRSAFGRVVSLLGGSEISSSSWDQVEESLLEADLGPHLARKISTQLKKTIQEEGLLRREDLRRSLQDLLLQGMPPTKEWEPVTLPTIVLLVGVNGSGKTTTVAKLAWHWKQRGKKVLLAAADTYRAAARDQLEVWAERVGEEVISGRPGTDPAAVAHDSAVAALARGVDLLLVDTAGRLHTRYNLMEELKKIRRVLGKVVAGAPQETWLVVDATTGQNGLAQAHAFQEAVGVSGAILAKLDGSARGGVAFAIQSELKIPIRYVGLGEGLEDLQPFASELFVEGLLEPQAAIS
ncbi:MAG: signal recognition particle-docking protein FtsY [Anaerolineales bacterium]|jgi:fused signal recognition particle receptor